MKQSNAKQHCIFQSFLWRTLRILVGEGNSNPLQYSCLESSKDREAWWTVAHGITKSWTQLYFFHFHLRISERVNQIGLTDFSCKFPAPFFSLSDAWWLFYFAFPISSVKNPTYSQQESFHDYIPTSDIFVSEEGNDFHWMWITLRPPVSLSSFLSDAEEDVSFLFHKWVSQPRLWIRPQDLSPTMTHPLPSLYFWTLVHLLANFFLNQVILSLRRLLLTKQLLY